MELCDSEFDAALDILTNNAIRNVLAIHEDVIEEEQMLRDRWNSRIPMFSAGNYDENYANDRIKALLNGHSELLRIRTRLSRFQFESLSNRLAEDGLRDSKKASVSTKLAIFIHICGQGALYRDVAEYWKVPWL